MTVEPLSEMQSRLADARVALDCMASQLELVARDIRQTFTGIVSDDSPWWDVANACDFQASVGRRAMARCDVADAEPVEPVAPIMQGFFSTRALDYSYRVHCATGHILSWHATEAEAEAEVARRVAAARPWTTEQILQHEG